VADALVKRRLEESGEAGRDDSPPVHRRLLEVTEPAFVEIEGLDDAVLDSVGQQAVAWIGVVVIGAEKASCDQDNDGDRLVESEQS